MIDREPTHPRAPRPGRGRADGRASHQRLGPRRQRVAPDKDPRRFHESQIIERSGCRIADSQEIAGLLPVPGHVGERAGVLSSPVGNEDSTQLFEPEPLASSSRVTRHGRFEA